MVCVCVWPSAKKGGVRYTHECVCVCQNWFLLVPTRFIIIWTKNSTLLLFYLYILLNSAINVCAQERKRNFLKFEFEFCCFWIAIHNWEMVWFFTSTFPTMIFCSKCVIWIFVSMLVIYHKSIGEIWWVFMCVCVCMFKMEL